MRIKKPKLASRKTCTGCMACTDACPFSAIGGFIDRDGHFYAKWIREKCTHCGRCSKICPIVSGYSYNNNSNLSTPYVAWAKNDELREHSASGGVFAALASCFFSVNGYVAGAIIEGCKVKHILTNDSSDLKLLQGSKYQQGDLTGIYKAVLEKLRSGEKILFSGTGCQIGALYSFLGGKKYENQLVTIDLICGGFPSILPLTSLQNNNVNSIKRIVSFRDKDKGWKSEGYKFSLKVVDCEDNNCDLGDQNLVLKCFSSQFLNRNSCLNCRFAFASRQADITIADFWGDKEYLSQHSKGLSVVIVHSIAGKESLNNAEINFEPILWSKFIYRNPRMIVGRFLFYNLHPGRIMGSWLFRHVKYSNLCKIYGVSNKRGIIGLPFMISSFLIRKMSGVCFRYTLNSLLKTLRIK